MRTSYIHGVGPADTPGPNPDAPRRDTGRDEPLPLLISVPHMGLQVPPEVAGYCALTKEQVAADGDVGALQIYSHLALVARAFVTTHVARAIIDVNRRPDDISKDGVVKTHTCWDVPVYNTAVPPWLLRRLIDFHHGRYHDELSELARQGEFVLGVDCHTMAAHGPPVGPDPGVERPLVCLSNADGTCPQEMFTQLAECLRSTFGADNVSLNVPFRGGYIIRAHGDEMPWVQLELSRTDAMSDGDKRTAVHRALEAFCGIRVAAA